jgi:indole-3-glycerol phosphate synthase
MSQIFIAEVKTKSPFGFVAPQPWEELFDLANEHGDWLSIHTNPLWGGSFDILAKARKITDKPILAKGIHASNNDIDRAFGCGADYVLVVGRLPSDEQGLYHSMDKILVEPLSFAQYLSWDKFQGEIPKVVFNRRDLSTGQKKNEEHSIWRNNSKWLCQASRLRSYDDVKKDVDAYIVGSNLPFFIDTLPKKVVV